MGNISERKLDDDTIRQLRLRAARHGVSMEEEARRILAAAVRSPERLGDLALTLFGPVNGVDVQLDEKTPHEPIDLDQ